MNEIYLYLLYYGLLSPVRVSIEAAASNLRTDRFNLEHHKS